jgi:2'-5' RNA ligase
VREAIAALSATEVGPAWTVNEVLLMCSDTKPTGAEHEVIARTALTG